MSFSDLLRASRENKTSVLHKFYTNYDPSSAGRVYLFVEGDPDRAFYKHFAASYVDSRRQIFVYNCEGKQKVLEAQDEIMKKYPGCKRVLFFVDKDIDDVLGAGPRVSPRLFISDGYSIENYFANKDVVDQFFANFVKLKNVECNLSLIGQQFEDHVSQFYRLLLPVMAWILAARRAGVRPVLNDVKMSELFNINDAGVSRRKGRDAIAYLRRVTQLQSDPTSWREIRLAARELSRLQPEKFSRGKFVGWALVTTLGRSLESLNIVAREGGGAFSCSVQLQESNFVQILAPVLACPDSLREFLAFHLSEEVHGNEETAQGGPFKLVLVRLASLFRRD